MMQIADPRAAFAARLGSRLPLAPAEADIIAALITQTELVKPHTDLVYHGERTPLSIALIDGYACRYKIGPHGQRQIISFHLPGEVINSRPSPQLVADHGIATLNPCRIARVNHAAIPNLFAEYPTIARAYWAEALIELAIAFEWMMNIGRREGYARVAHLFCELAIRMEVIGRDADHSFEFPVSQIDLADATGMTAIHMNRILQRLRIEGVLSVSRHCITIHDWARLQEIGDFDPAYLCRPIEPADAMAFDEIVTG